MSVTFHLSSLKIIAVVPAAGNGSRMSLKFPKQYIKINNCTILEHSVNSLLTHPKIRRVVIVLNKLDNIFHSLSISSNPRVCSVFGGDCRSHSVLAGLLSIKNDADWVIVHDAVRPCLQHEDLEKVINLVNTSRIGGILAFPVCDTIKYSDDNSNILCTINRNQLWYALTPQCFPLKLLKYCLKKSIKDGLNITDEASAIEYCGYHPEIIKGSNNNIKVTFPEDIILVTCLMKHFKKKI